MAVGSATGKQSAVADSADWRLMNNVAGLDAPPCSLGRVDYLAGKIFKTQFLKLSMVQGGHPPSYLRQARSGPGKAEC